MVKYKVPFGGVAQLGERSVRIREVKGSNPSVSTKDKRPHEVGSFIFGIDIGRIRSLCCEAVNPSVSFFLLSLSSSRSLCCEAANPSVSLCLLPLSSSRSLCREAVNPSVSLCLPRFPVFSQQAQRAFFSWWKRYRKDLPQSGKSLRFFFILRSIIVIRIGSLSSRRFFISYRRPAFQRLGKRRSGVPAFGSIGCRRRTWPARYPRFSSGWAARARAAADGKETESRRAPR